MQILVDKLLSKGRVYKKIQEVSPKNLGLRNKIKLFSAIDTSNKYWAIFALSQKSRILRKDVEKFEDICQKLSVFCEHEFKYKIIFIDAPLCSKAKLLFEQSGWKIQ